MWDMLRPLLFKSTLLKSVNVTGYIHTEECVYTTKKKR